jgi:hypothetical protein
VTSLALAFTILGKDAGASKTLDKVGDKADKTARRINGAFAGMGTRLVGAFAGIAAVSAFKGFIDEAEESRKIGRLTEQVIKSTGKAAKISAKQVGALATAISNKTGVDDEAIQSGANLLLTFTGIRNEVGKGNRIFDRATETITDMSVALGQDTKASAIQLGKALNDPIKGVTALSRVGVSFTKQQKDQIKTLVESGKTLDAQKIILAELGREFGGAAQAAASPTQKLAVILGNLKEQIGTALLPVVDRFATFLGQKVIPALSDLGGKVGPIVSDIAGAVGRLASTLRTKGEAAVRAFADPFLSIGSRIQEGLDAFVPDVKQFAANLSAGLRESADVVIAGVKTGLEEGDWKPLGKTIGDALIKVLEGAGDLATKFTAAIGSFMKRVDWVGLGIAIGKQVPALLIGLTAGILNFDVASLFKGVMKHWLDVLLGVLALAFVPARIVGKISQALARIPLVGRLLAWFFEGMVKVSKGIVGAVGKVLKALGTAFTRGLIPEGGRVVGALKGFFSTIVTSIYVRADDFLKSGLNLIRKVGEGILKGAQLLGSAVRFIVSKLLGWLRDGLAFAGRAAVDALGRALSRIPGLVSALGGLIRSAASGIWNGLGAALRSHLQFIRSSIGAVVDIVKGMKGRISGAAHGMWDGIKDAFKAAINFIIRGWNSLRFHISIPKNGPFGIPIPGGGKEFGFGVPPIHELAHGALVRGGRGGILARVGEGRGDELVLPVEKFLDKMKAGRTYGDVYVTVAKNETAMKVPMSLRMDAWVNGY